MNNHTFHTYRFFIFFLSSLCLSSCTSEYVEYVKSEQNISTLRVSSGSISGEFSILPDKRILEGLVEKIENADERIWISTYTWTEKSTLAAVLDAKKRNLDIRVILEGNVFMTPFINDTTVKQLRGADIDFAYSNERRYTFNHIKFWIIDSEWCISTGNWSYTSFTKNREFLYCSDDSDIRNNLEELFLADFRYKKPYFSGGLDDRIGLAPQALRPWLFSHLKKAEKSILIYNQSITDDELLSFLLQQQRDGKEIILCQAHNDDTLVEVSNEISSYGLTPLFSKKPYLHAKAVVIDGERVIIGSANFTQNAFENNREILIDLGKNMDIAKSIKVLSDKECKAL